MDQIPPRLHLVSTSCDSIRVLGRVDQIVSRLNQRMVLIHSWAAPSFLDLNLQIEMRHGLNGVRLVFHATRLGATNRLTFYLGTIAQKARQKSDRHWRRTTSLTMEYVFSENCLRLQ